MEPIGKPSKAKPEITELIERQKSRMNSAKRNQELQQLPSVLKISISDIVNK